MLFLSINLSGRIILIYVVYIVIVHDMQFTGDERDHEIPPEMPIIDKSNVMQLSMGPSTSTASASLSKYHRI